MKKYKGFTLIELIVVIAIIGVLAAILIPAMMGWIVKARITTYNSNSKELFTKLQALITDLDTGGSSLDELGNCQIVFAGGDITGTPDLSDEHTDMIAELNNNLSEMSGFEWAARVERGAVMAVVLTGNDGGNVGGYPVLCPKDGKYKMDRDTAIENYLPCAEGDPENTWDSKIAH